MHGSNAALASDMDPDAGPLCAAALFEADELRLIWCNEHYLELLEEPYRSQGAGGQLLEEFSPLTYSLRSNVMREVADTGEPRAGEDRIFSVENGMEIYRWAVHSPQPEHVLTMIHVTRPS
jgi:hypothetical protein